jgi:hypothetical protein
VKLNERQAEAVIRLRNNQDFKDILEAIDAYGSECFELALFGPEDMVATSRGMARSITEVMRTLGTADNYLLKLRSRK